MAIPLTIHECISASTRNKHWPLSHWLHKTNRLSNQQNTNILTHIRYHHTWNRMKWCGNEKNEIRTLLLSMPLPPILLHLNSNQHPFNTNTPQFISILRIPALVLQFSEIFFYSIRSESLAHTLTHALGPSHHRTVAIRYDEGEPAQSIKSDAQNTTKSRKIRAKK